MAKRYSVEDLLDCVASLQPIQAHEVADLIEDTLNFRGQPVDLNACRWTGRPPRSCNFRVLIDLIVGGTITSLQDLQRLHACARVIGVLDDEESSMSTSSDSTSSPQNTSESSQPGLDCDNYLIRSPQRYETFSNTVGVIMDVTHPNPFWDAAIANGTLRLAILEVIAKKYVNFRHGVSVNNTDGTVSYSPSAMGFEGGDTINIHVRAWDLASGCVVTFWLNVIVSEEQTATT